MIHLSIRELANGDGHNGEWVGAHSWCGLIDMSGRGKGVDFSEESSAYNEGPAQAMHAAICGSHQGEGMLHVEKGLRVACWHGRAGEDLHG